MSACVTGSFSGVFLFACLPVEWKNGKLKWPFFLTHLLIEVYFWQWCFWASCHDCMCTHLLRDLPSSFLVRCIAKACGASFNSKLIVIICTIFICTYLSGYAGVISLSAYICHCHPHISLPSVPHSLFLPSGLMVSTWSTCKENRASSSFVKLRRQRGSGWSSLTWQCEYDYMVGFAWITTSIIVFLSLGSWDLSCTVSTTVCRWDNQMGLSAFH